MTADMPRRAALAGAGATLALPGVVAPAAAATGPVAILLRRVAP